MAEIIGVKIPGIMGSTFVLVRRDAWETILATYVNPTDFEATTEDGSIHVDLTSLVVESEVVYDPEEDPIEVFSFIEDHEDRSAFDALCNELSDTWEIFNSLRSGDVYDCLHELKAERIFCTGRGLGVNQVTGFLGKRFFSILVDEDEDAVITVDGVQVGDIHYANIDELKNILSPYKVTNVIENEI
jgi:hypothetical protein